MWLQLQASLSRWSTAISQLSLRAQRSSHLVTSPQLQVNQLMKRVCTRGAVHRPPLITWPNSHNYGLQVHLQTRMVTASKLARSQPQGVSLKSLDYGLQVCISKWISKLARSLPPSVFPNSVDLSLQVHLKTALISECISKFTWSRPPSASLDSLDHILQVYVQTPSIPVSKCIYKLPRSWSASLSSPHHGLQVYLQICPITTSKCISKLPWLRPRSVSLNLLDHDFQGHLALPSCTACSDSRYVVCRWVAIWIHRYIDENTNWIHEFWKWLNDKQ